MNEYEIGTFEMYSHPQTRLHRVCAHSAADALTCFEKNNPRADVRHIWCVERTPPPPPAPTRPELRGGFCLACSAVHGDGVACPFMQVT